MRALLRSIVRLPSRLWGGIVASWRGLDLDARDLHAYGGLVLLGVGIGLAWRPEGALMAVGLGLVYFARPR